MRSRETWQVQDTLDAAREGQSSGSGVEHLFALIAASSGSPEHFAAIQGLNDRLRPVRRAEAAFLPDSAAELREMQSALQQDALASLRRMVSAYHRRRERLAPEIVAALQARF